MARRSAKLSELLSGSDDRFLLEAFRFASGLDAGSVLNRQEPTNSTFVRAIAENSGAPLLGRLMNLEFYGFVPDHNLTYTDKAAMQQAIETRVPFLDTRLLEFASGMRTNQLATPTATKVLLKECLKPVLPHDVLYRPKTGFGAPVRKWLFEDRPDYMMDVLTSERCRNRGVFNQDAVTDIIDRTARKEVDGAYFVLSLLMVELWCRRFLDVH
jgi:asparagine synthase (glutamine-hydrolysing)